MLVASVSLSDKNVSINHGRTKSVAIAKNEVSFQRQSSHPHPLNKFWIYGIALVTSCVVIFCNSQPSKSQMDTSDATFLATYGSDGTKSPFNLDDCRKALKLVDDSRAAKGIGLVNLMKKADVKCRLPIYR